jgi:hypothetical protein
MGGKKQRHQAKVARERGPVIENHGLSITMPMGLAVPPGMGPADVLDEIEEMGGMVEPCDGCPGFIAHGFTAGPYVGGAMHFGPEGCPSRHKVPKLPVQ